MYIIEKEILEINIPEKLSHSTFFEVDIPLENYKYVIYNFNNTKKITLAGALTLISLAAYLCEYTKKTRFFDLFCDIDFLNEKSTNFLMNFGFFKEMVSKANLRILNNIDLSLKKNILELESKFVNNQINKTKTKEKVSSLIMPIMTIPIGSEDLYETRIYKFRNAFFDFYKNLVENGILISTAKNDEENLDDYSEVLNAILEVIKNIYDHSKSWGLGAIHARNNHVEIVYQDIGIGIEGSMKDNSNFRSLNEKEAIISALKDNVTSKGSNVNNMGSGFTIIKDFVTDRNGYLSISTGHYNIVNNNFKQINKCYGTQIVLYI